MLLLVSSDALLVMLKWSPDTNCVGKSNNKRKKKEVHFQGLPTPVTPRHMNALIKHAVMNVSAQPF